MKYEAGTNYASNGKANAALTTGIIGTAGVVLGAMNGNSCGNGGLFGNLFGNNQCYVTEKEAQYMTALAIAQSEKNTAETSKNDLERFYTVVRQTDASIADGLIQTGNALGVLSADVKCLQREVDRNREESFRNLQEARSYTDTRVDCLAENTKSEIEKTYLWTRAQNYVTGSVKVDPDQICGPSPLSCGCN